jgi:hypothetical protein
MTLSHLTSYCLSHDLTLLEGFNLISSAIKQASNSASNIVPIEDDKGAIGFVIQTADGEFRAIEMKPSLLEKSSRKLERLVQRYQLSKETGLLQSNKEKREIVRGAIDDSVPNGWFVNLPNIRAFMPIKEAVEKEAGLGLYSNNRQSLYFQIVSSSREKNGKPRVILSRRSVKLSKAIAEDTFAMYGFVSLKRQAGIKQTILVRAYPQKHHQALYQSYFPTERLIFHKLMPDGTIKRPTRDKAKEMRREKGTAYER